MQSVVKISLITHAILSLLLALVSPAGAAYYFSGGLILLFAMVGTSLIFDQAVNKKRIALSASIIVSKYTVLGYLCWYFSKFKGVQLQWILGSVFSLVLAFLIYAYNQQKLQVTPASPECRTEKEEKCLSIGHS